MNRFQDKTAIITGAGEGIGYGIAKQLAAEGAKVVLNDIDEAKAKQAAEAIRDMGYQCIAHVGDVSSAAIIEDLASLAITSYTTIDIAVANAGITLWNNFFDYKAEDLNKVLNLNLAGSFLLAQAAAIQMRKQGTGGKLLFMSSVTGYQAIEYLSAYAMTKAALRMLAKQLVVELGPYGINVNAIAPGATITPRNLADDPNYEKVWSDITPNQKTASVDDIANAALFLLSPQAEQITGQTIVVDGGWTSISPVPRLDFVESDANE